MNLMEFLGYMFVILFLSYIFTSRERKRGRRYVRVAKTPPGPRPVTPQPRYICENCGMLIHTGHGHTQEECEAYEKDPTMPDLTLRRIMKERPGRNDPRVRTPYYHELGTFRNWGAGK